MAIEKVELMHEYFPQHLLTETARIKYDKEIEEEGKQKE